MAHTRSVLNLTLEAASFAFREFFRPITALPGLLKRTRAVGHPREPEQKDQVGLEEAKKFGDTVSKSLPHQPMQ